MKALGNDPTTIRAVSKSNSRMTPWTAASKSSAADPDVGKTTAMERAQPFGEGSSVSCANQPKAEQSTLKAEESGNPSGNERFFDETACRCDLAESKMLLSR